MARARAIESDIRGESGVRINRVEFRENVRTFFPQGQSKLSVLSGCT